MFLFCTTNLSIKILTNYRSCAIFFTGLDKNKNNRKKLETLKNYCSFGG